MESRIDLFGDEDGAREELGAASREHRAAVRRAGGAGRMLQPEIGDEAVGFTVVEQALKDVRTFTVEWRQGRVTASITANGFDKRLKLEDVLALAHKQARRIDAER